MKDEPKNREAGPGAPPERDTPEGRPGALRLFVDGRPVEARWGQSVAAALLSAGVTRFRTSVAGQGRGPVCGMGTCFECRVTIDGAPHRRACLVAVAEGMEVVTGG